MIPSPKQPAATTIRDLAASLIAEGVVPPRRIDCGSGHHYGICPVCGKGHGYVMFMKPSAIPVNKISSKN